MGTSSHLAMLSKGPEVWRKDSKVLRKLKGGAVGMGTPLQILIPALRGMGGKVQGKGWEGGREGRALESPGCRMGRRSFLPCSCHLA